MVCKKSFIFLGIGTRLDTIALTDKIFQLTGSNFSISMVFILEGLPMLFLGVIAGNFVEVKYIFILCACSEIITALYFLKKHSSESISTISQ